MRRFIFGIAIGAALASSVAHAQYLANVLAGWDVVKGNALVCRDPIMDSNTMRIECD